MMILLIYYFIMVIASIIGRFMTMVSPFELQIYTEAS